MPVPYGPETRLPTFFLLAQDYEDITHTAGSATRRVSPGLVLDNVGVWTPAAHKAARDAPKPCLMRLGILGSGIVG